jgi:hypothetical protein
VEKTMTTVSIAPPNSLIVIAAAPTGEGPTEWTRGSGVMATEACIVVACLMEQDGETRITIASSANVKPGTSPMFEGFLKTPHHKVAVWTVEWEKLLEANVPMNRTRIRIWTNRGSEPDKIDIGLGEE